MSCFISLCWVLYRLMILGSRWFHISILSFNEVYIHIYVYTCINIYMHIYKYIYTCTHSQPISAAGGVISVSQSWQTRAITLQHTATHTHV